MQACSCLPIGMQHLWMEQVRSKQPCIPEARSQTAIDAGSQQAGSRQQAGSKYASSRPQAGSRQAGSRHADCMMPDENKAIPAVQET
jgi:hypothetical protein